MNKCEFVLAFLIVCISSASGIIKGKVVTRGHFIAIAIPRPHHPRTLCGGASIAERYILTTAKQKKDYKGK